VRCCYVCRTQASGSGRLIVDVLRDFFFVDQGLVAVEIALSFYVVSFRFFDLGLRGDTLFFGRSNTGRRG
jgi:hypothetical protein